MRTYVLYCSIEKLHAHVLGTMKIKIVFIVVAAGTCDAPHVKLSITFVAATQGYQTSIEAFASTACVL